MRFKKLFAKLLLSTALLTPLTSPLVAQSAPIDARVHERFLATYTGVCDELLTGPDLTAMKPAIYQLFYRNAYDEKSQPANEYRLYEYPCYAGAYNFSSLYFSANEYNEVAQLYFAFPDFDVTYKDDEESVVDQITLNGFSTWESLTNPGYDEKTMTLYSNSRWRGLGDASSSGRWEFRKGSWVLTTYDIDPTYDGEISMIRIFGEGTPPAYD